MYSEEFKSSLAAVEAAPKPSPPVRTIGGETGSFLPLNLFGSTAKKLLFPTAPGRKKCGERDRIPHGQVPGVPVAGQQCVPGQCCLTGLGIQAPEAVLVICNAV